MRFKNTSDHIEAYIKAILEQSGMVELQRSQLADTFQVVPSQINYVIKTRFTESRGYLVESKRGGGGYIRIGRIEFSNHHEMLRDLLYSVGEEVSQVVFEESQYFQGLSPKNLTYRVLNDSIVKDSQGSKKEVAFYEI